MLDVLLSHAKHVLPDNCTMRQCSSIREALGVRIGDHEFYRYLEMAVS